MRQSLKNTLKSSLLDGRFREAVAVIKKEKAEKELEHMRLGMQETFQGAMDDGRLLEVVTAMKNEKKAKEIAEMQQSVKSTLQASLGNGRLSEAISALLEEKKAKELQKMKQTLKMTFQSSLCDGRLAEVVATVKKERQAKELENMRQDLCSSLQSSLLDGRLAGVMSSLKEQRQQAEKQQLEQDALLEVEAMRANVQSCFRFALDSGRLTEVFAKVRADNVAKTIVTAAAAPVQHAPASQPVEIDVVPADAPEVATSAQPAKPSADKTTAARPSRRSLRTAATGELQEQQTAIQQSPVADCVKLPSPKVSMLPPRPPALGSSVTESPKSVASMSMRTLTPRASLTQRLGESLSRPASPVGRLPPVQAPLRKSAAPAAPSAMALDLGMGPSAMSLDLCSAKPPVPTAMSLDLGAEWKTCHSRSLSNVRLEKASWKQAPSFLPPISGLKGQVTKSSVHKRSSSMDSFVWGVAPAHLERIDVNTVVF